MPIVLKSGSLYLLELSGLVQAYNGIALPFYSLLLEAEWTSRLQCGGKDYVNEKFQTSQETTVFIIKELKILAPLLSAYADINEVIEYM